MKGRRLKLHCCERCQIYWTCEEKWYRGERHEEDVCCPLCNFYNQCLAKLNKRDRERMLEFNKDKQKS